MRYKITFQVSRENSGKATYLGKRLKCYTPPYQVYIPESNKCEQYFEFEDINTLNTFLKDSFEAFTTDFVVTNLRLTDQ